MTRHPTEDAFLNFDPRVQLLGRADRVAKSQTLFGARYEDSVVS
jgi:hypothetical protein